MKATRVVRDADVVRFITDSYPELIRYFRNLCNPDGKLAESWDNRTRNEVESLWCFVYDDRREVQLEMGGDLLVLDKLIGGTFEGDRREYRPGRASMPLDIKQFLLLNGEYKSLWIQNKNL